MTRQNGALVKAGFWILTTLVGIIIMLVGAWTTTTVGGFDGDLENLATDNTNAHNEIKQGIKDGVRDHQAHGVVIQDHDHRITICEQTDKYINGRLGRIENEQKELKLEMTRQYRLLEKIDKKIPETHGGS